MAAQKETDLLSAGGGPADAFAESPMYPDDAPEPEELQHALIAFYLVLVSLPQCAALLLSLPLAMHGCKRLPPTVGAAVAAAANPAACLLNRALQFVMFGAQAGLVSWRKKHRRSYDLATLVGLWLIPPMISVQLGACAAGRWRQPRHVGSKCVAAGQHRPVMLAQNAGAGRVTPISAV